MAARERTAVSQLSKLLDVCLYVSFLVVHYSSRIGQIMN